MRVMAHRETWYKRILREKKKEVLASAAFVILFSLAISLWSFFTGKAFEWQSISPVEAPALLPRLFYSALVFVSLGALLYYTGFYKFLYSFFRGGGRAGYRDYVAAKGFIWGVLILIMYFVIIPFVVDVLNGIISFFYNIFNLVLYLSPSFAISAIMFGGSYAIYRHKALK